MSSLGLRLLQFRSLPEFLKKETLQKLNAAGQGPKLGQDGHGARLMAQGGAAKKAATAKQATSAKSKTPEAARKLFLSFPGRAWRP